MHNDNTPTGSGHRTRLARGRALWLAFVILALSAVVGPRAHAATTYTVCPSGCDFDNVDAAVIAAVDGDTIEIAAGTYHQIAGPITIYKDLSLRGAGADVTILDRAPGSTGRIFTIQASAEVVIEDMTISGGSAMGGAEIKSSACAGEGSSLTLESISLVEDTPLSFSVSRNQTARSKSVDNLCEVDPTSGTVSITLGINGYGGAYGKSAGEGDLHTQGPAVSDVTIDMTLRGGGISNAGLLTLRGVKVSQNALTGTATAESVAYDDAESATAQGTVVVRLLGGGIYNTGSLTIERSTISGNSVSATITNAALATGESGTTAAAHADTYAVVGGGIYNAGSLTMRDSTISGNTATSTVTAAADTGGASSSSSATADPVIIGGGGLGNTGSIYATNNTISGNDMTTTVNGDVIHLYAAGGVYDNRQPATLNFTTVADNELDATLTGTQDGVSAGGIVTALAPAVPVTPVVEPIMSTAARSAIVPTPPGGNLHVFGSIVSDNSGGDCARGDALVVHSGYSLSGDGSCDIPQGDAGLGPLANNGGPTETHLPAADGDAIDRVPLPNCASYSLTTDQRGAPRPLDDGCDAGSVEVEGAGDDIFVSATTAGTTGDGLAFGPEDIIQWDGSAWSIFFDGSAAGLTPNGAAKHDISAFYVEPPGTDFVLMSFAQNARVVPGVGKVDGMDAVVWNGLYFTLVFDGQDVGLTNKTSEKIDGLHLLGGSEAPPELIASAGGHCQVYMLVSTQGPGKVPNYSGGTLSFGGEDVLGFCFTSNGDFTSGKWIMVLDGSAQGMPKNSTDGISLSEDGQTLYLTTKGTFNVDDATGGHSMVYAYDMMTGDFSGPLFSAPANGLPAKVDGLQYEP